MKALQQAANAENFFCGVKDIPVVARSTGQMEQYCRPRNWPTAWTWQRSACRAIPSAAPPRPKPWAGRKTSNNVISFTDRRIKAAIAMSPSIPSNGADPKRVFDEVKIPWMLMTGTKDASPLSKSDPAARRRVYAALPANGNKYELVLDNAEHSALV